MNNTDNEGTGAEWRWHRQDSKHKSHLMARLAEGTVAVHVFIGSCGFNCVGVEQNNDMTDPCKRCLRSAAGRAVGRG